MLEGKTERLDKKDLDHSYEQKAKWEFLLLPCFEEILENQSIYPEIICASNI